MLPFLFSPFAAYQAKQKHKNQYHAGLIEDVPAALFLLPSPVSLPLYPALTSLSSHAASAEKFESPSQPVDLSMWLVRCRDIASHSHCKRGGSEVQVLNLIGGFRQSSIFAGLCCDGNLTGMIAPRRSFIGGARATSVSSRSRSGSLMPSLINLLPHFCCWTKVKVLHFRIMDLFNNCTHKATCSAIYQWSYVILGVTVHLKIGR